MEDYISARDEESEKIRFKLDGCDICFIAEAPADITLAQLIVQCDKIRPDWCACGIRSLNESEACFHTEIEIGYESIRKTSDDVCCQIIDVQEASE